MATSKEFHDYILEHLKKAGEVSTRKMMGEYCVYYKGKLVGDLCDNRLLLKPAKAVLRRMPDADMAFPYKGAKTQMVVVEQVEDTKFMAEMLDEMYQELPEQKSKQKRGSKKEDDKKTKEDSVKKA